MICSKCGKEKKYIIRSVEDMKELDYDSTYENINGDICSECFIEEKGINTLYHLSMDNYTHTLTPRIPSNRAKGEDNTIPRVSTSISIEGCISAVPWGGHSLEDIFTEAGSPAIKVLEFDIDDVGIENIIPADYLYQNNLVVDAFENQEYWITKEVNPSDVYYIVVTDYQEDCADYITCDNMIKSLRENHRRYENYIDGSFTVIESVEYFTFRGNYEVDNHMFLDLLLKPTGNISLKNPYWASCGDEDLFDTFEKRKKFVENFLDLYGDGFEFHGEIYESDKGIVVEGDWDWGYMYYHSETIYNAMIEEFSQLFEVRNNGNIENIA